MRCPTLAELPPAPERRTGWPWTEDTAAPAVAPDRPRITIVTPCLNRAELIEETIRSVLLQGYPDLEYIVVDGGSSDGTVEIIRRYAPWLAWWVSEPDEGQSDALNKGFERATGQVRAYLNADDLYTPGALPAVGQAFAGGEVHWLSGPARLFGPGVGPGYTWPRETWRERWQWLAANKLAQSSTFWSRKAGESGGPFHTDLHVSMDYEYWLRLLAAGYELRWTERVLSEFRIHAGSITGAWDGAFPQEDERVRRQYMDMLTERERRLAERKRHEMLGRRYRWRAWRRAWAGRCGASLADLARAVAASPRLAWSPRTWAVPPVAALGRLRPRRRDGGPEGSE